MTVARGYQERYSEHHPGTFDRDVRRAKVKTILAILGEYTRRSGRETGDMVCLDVGCSAGTISAGIASAVSHVVGTDYDALAVLYAFENQDRRNCSFACGDAMQLPFDDASFDLVICNHLYEHVPDATRLFDEIGRVLMPDGICYLADGNRLVLVEPHYKLPLLSWLPRPLASLYVRMVCGDPEYYERMCTRWGMLRMLRGWKITDYTRRVIRAPKKYGLELGNQPTQQKTLRIAAMMPGPVIDWFSPTWIWILEPIRPRMSGSRGAQLTGE